MTNDTLRLILDKNPGLLSILLTGVLLPLGILWLTNIHTRKQKQTEKSLENKYNSKINLRKQEQMIYSSLSKILFDVQQLHISVAGICDSKACITEALKIFDESVSKYHGDISNNMLYLSSEVINLVYKFYKLISELKIELGGYEETKEYELAPVSVYFSSLALSDVIIEIQGIFMGERGDLKIHFDKAHQEMMKQCCGAPPSEELRKKYDMHETSLAIKGTPST
jgi:hypothetical protein